MRRLIAFFVCILCIASVANAIPCEYSSRFGHFVVNEDSELSIQLYGDQTQLKSSTLYYIAFSINGNTSGTIPIRLEAPIRLGRFMTSTSITFWFTSLSPMAMPPYNMAVTHDIKVVEHPDGSHSYRLENDHPAGELEFRLNAKTVAPSSFLDQPSSKKD